MLAVVGLNARIGRARCSSRSGEMLHVHSLLKTLGRAKCSGRSGQMLALVGRHAHPYVLKVASMVG